MSPDIHDIINAIQEKWLEDLNTYLNEHFRKVFLPSHDQTHHLRTWYYARRILLTLWEENKTFSEDFVEAVLLASMFHDTGMTISRRPDHGTIGRDIYEEYISGQPERKPLLHMEISRAIDMHDRKDQDIHIPFTHVDIPDLTTLISIADDLDALGVVGIYRYAEIYLKRGVSMQDLGIKILHNVALRYNHFSKAVVMFPHLIRSTKSAYSEIISFYDEYNQQLLSDINPYIVFSGHIGVINYIRNFSVEGKVSPKDFRISLDNFLVGKYVLDFFNKLHNEYTNYQNS